MMVENLISIIIPVYNIKMNYLESCIDSILQQTYCQFEIVIVDDGSCRKCAAALENIKKKDDRIFVYHKKNEGVSVARNYGLKQSRGEYIIYADGDDLLMPYYLENGIKHLIANNADIVIGKIVNTKSRDISELQVSTKNKDQCLEKSDLIAFRQHVFSKKEKDWGKDCDNSLFNFEGCWAHLLKRDVAERELFIAGISIGEDTIWAMQLSDCKKEYRICLVYEVWYLYIQNEESVLHKYRSDMPEVLTRVNSLIFEEIKNQDDLATQYYNWVFVKLRQIIFNYLSKECKLGMIDKINEYRKLMHNDTWENILGDNYILPKRYKNRCIAFKHGLILVYFKLRIRMEGK